MELLRSLIDECQFLLMQGGVVLWAILAVGVWLYTMLANTWSAVMPMQQQIQQGVRERPDSERREIVRDYAIFELETLAWVDRRIPVIGVMIGVCSLGGLLGTVSGMLETFQNMSSQASGDVMEKIAAGISEALITTQAGLLIALPAAFFFVLLQSKVKAVHQLLEKNLHGDLAEFYKGGQA